MTEADYIAAQDNASDYNDAQIFMLEQQAREDIDAHFRGDGRDDGLWVALGVSPDLTVADYDEVETDERDIPWTEGLAGIGAASSTQFLLDNLEETIVKPVAYREQVLSAFALSQAELVTAGKRGFEVVTQARFQALQARFLDDLSFLKEMSNVELFDALSDYGAIRPADKLIADQMGYVARMTNHKPGSVQFKEEVSKLIDHNSTRVLKGQNRRAVEGLSAYREADGDLQALMVWIGEGGKNTCQYCLHLFGAVATYNEFLNEIGMPGADVCAGGDLCRCHLAAV